MKKFYLGIILFIAGLLCAFKLLLITIEKEVEIYTKLWMIFFFLLFFVGLVICVYESYIKK